MFKNLNQTGTIILAAALVLNMVGIATIYTVDTAYVAGHDGPLNALKQTAFLLLSVVAFRWVLVVGYRQWGDMAYVLFGLAFCLLIPLLIAKVTGNTFGGLLPRRNGAYRWIALPLFQFQPSEIMKVGWAVALAWHLKYREEIRSFRALLTPIAATLLPLLFILLEPDLGTALLLLMSLFVVLFVAGARTSHLALLVLGGLLLVPVAWQVIEPYQKRRITTLLMQSDQLREAVRKNPERYAWLDVTRKDAIEWSRSAGYQLLASKRAIGSGGPTGYGWGKGIYVEQRVLPDSHNDFIFSMVGHQFGFVGTMLIIAMYVVMIGAGVHIAMQSTDAFARMLAVAIIALLGSQVVVNVGMTIGLLPITGMTLPFVSQGGSSLVISYVLIGLLVSAGLKRPFNVAGRRSSTLRPKPMESGLFDKLNEG